MEDYYKLTKPLIGYTKIKCHCERQYLWPMKNQKIDTINVLATLEIPVNSIVKKSLVNDTLQTDNAIFIKDDELKPYHISRYFSKLTKCKCFSIFDKDFEFILGNHHKSKITSINEVSEKYSIKFFLDKEIAKKY